MAAHRVIELALEGTELGAAWAKGAPRNRLGAGLIHWITRPHGGRFEAKQVPRLLELLSTMPGSRRLSETWLETADVALGVSRI